MSDIREASEYWVILPENRDDKVTLRSGYDFTAYQGMIVTGSLFGGVRHWKSDEFSSHNNDKRSEK